MADEVRAEHVKLSWQPPVDDGGTPITNYLVRYMDIDTGEWVSACTVSCNLRSFVSERDAIGFCFRPPDAAPLPRA